MLNLDEALKQTVERVKRDRYEDDKIYLNVSDLVGVAIRQHAKEMQELALDAGAVRRRLHEAQAELRDLKTALTAIALQERKIRINPKRWQRARKLVDDGRIIPIYDMTKRRFEITILSFIHST